MVNQNSNIKIQNYKSKFKNFTFYIIILIFTFYTLNLFFPSAIAQAPDLGRSRINAASPFYFLKSSKEAFQLKLAQNNTQARADYQLRFALERLKEVNSLVYTPGEQLIEPTLDRYLFHLRELQNVWDLGSDKAQTALAFTITTQMDVLQRLYPQISDTRAKRSVRATINSLSGWDVKLIKQLSELKKDSLARQVKDSRLSGCRFLEKAASSSALEVERSILQRRAEECLKVEL